MTEVETAKAIREAIKGGDEAEVAHLIGGNPERLHALTPFGTWLHVAAAHGKLAVAERPVSLGADVNRRAGMFEAGPLEEAASEGHAQVAAFLLARGARPDVSRPETNPLFMAIRAGYAAIAKLLLDHGIDATVEYGKDGQGRTRDALNLARQCERPEIADLLLAAGVTPRAEAPPESWADLPRPRKKPGLTEAQLAVVESRLGLRLPPHYRNFLANFPKAMHKPDAKDGDGWNWLGPDAGLFHTVRGIVEYNRAARGHGVPGSDDESKPWPEKHLVIGTNGGGDYFCIRADAAGDVVYFHDHETGRFRSLKCTPEEHAANLVAAGW